jgi:DNA modification methylase
MLGFYSIYLFLLSCYSIKINIIWNKGEVQSKRNSSANHFSGYLKPINVYEHNFVFTKKSIKPQKTIIKNIDTVKKINCKGQNILGHTAPFPIKIAELIVAYSKNGYILDPFLGSGTTVIASILNKKKSIGVELNEEYYELAKKRIGYYEKIQ